MSELSNEPVSTVKDSGSAFDYIFKTIIPESLKKDVHSQFIGMAVKEAKSIGYEYRVKFLKRVGAYDKMTPKQRHESEVCEGTDDCFYCGDFVGGFEQVRPVMDNDHDDSIDIEG